MGTSKNAIVFDLDDTLYLERDFAASGFAVVGRFCETELGLSGVAARANEAFNAGQRQRIFNDVLASYGLEPEKAVLARLVALYRNHEPDIHLLDDARACLNKLHGRTRLALITDGPSRTQWNKIRALGIEKLFDVIVVTNDLGAEFSKPHPRAFEIVEERLNGPGQNLVYVADNPVKDFKAPRTLGWKTVRIRREGGIYAHHLSDGAADHEIENLWEFPKKADPEQPESK